MIPDAIPTTVHSIRFILNGRYDDLEPRVFEAGFTDSLFLRRDGKNYLVVDRGDPKLVCAHAVTIECLEALTKAGIQVVAIEVYDIDETITAGYHDACDIAQRWLDDEMDDLEPHSKITLTIERYEIGLEDYLEAYSQD